MEEGVGRGFGGCARQKIHRSVLILLQMTVFFMMQIIVNMSVVSSILAIS